ncbi:extracellular solute-binding protein [Abiotrophia defectiva]|uniref:extracellular solute-binding protein n=1 Tax=Abiotrophia defectiva TaxID=46125 RepID=UPI0028E2DBDB|nr:extracellular solute-binding protein [Abiotrophia defectiva]
MKFNWKKLAIGTMSAAMALAAFPFGAVKVATAQEAKLVISGGGLTDYLKENIKDFEEKNNVKVEISDNTDMFGMLDALALDGPAGNGADVYIAPNDRVGALAKAGHLSEVKLLDDAKYDDKDKQGVSIDGKVYGAPSVIESIIMYYNKDLLKEAPKSFDDLMALSKDDKYKFEGEEGKNVAFLGQLTNFYYSYGVLSGYGGYVFGKNGTDPKDIGLNNDKSVEAINYISDWYKNVWPKGMLDVKSSYDFLKQSFIDGKTAAVIAGPWEAKAFKDAKVNLGAAKLPSLPGGNEYKPFAGGKAWVISEYSENKELAQKFLDWASSEEQQNKLYKGFGEVPANHVAREAAAKDGNEITKAVIDTFANAVPMPNIPEMAEVWPGAENLIFDAASGNKSAKEAADAAVELIKQAIEQKHGE